MTRARLVCPALRWRRGSFGSEQSNIAEALAAGVGGFILFGGTRAAVAALNSSLRDRAQRPLLLGSDFERGPGQQVRGMTELPPPAALGYLNDVAATYECGRITAVEARVEEALGRYGKALGSGEQRRRRSARGAPAVRGLGAVLLPLSILIALALAAGVALAVIELVGDSTTRTRRNLTIVGVGLAVFPGGAGWVRCHGVVAQRRARGFLLVVATPREDWPIRVAFLLQALAVRSPRCILKLPQMR